MQGGLARPWPLPLAPFAMTIAAVGPSSSGCSYESVKLVICKACSRCEKALCTTAGDGGGVGSIATDLCDVVVPIPFLMYSKLFRAGELPYIQIKESKVRIESPILTQKPAREKVY